MYMVDQVRRRDRSRAEPGKVLYCPYCMGIWCKWKNFIKTMLRLGQERGAVSVVNDQIGSPTYTYDLSKLLVAMIQTDKYGRYHATNEGLCSWYEFACEIFRQAGMDEVKVTPVESSAFPVKAKRPSNSRLNKDKLTENGFERLPAWQDALGRYLEELKKNDMF